MKMISIQTDHLRHRIFTPQVITHCCAGGTTQLREVAGAVGSGSVGKVREKLATHP